MKDFLLKLANGQKTFKCDWNGENNECEVLKIDFEMSRAFVRFKKPVKKIVRREIENYQSFGMTDDDNELHMEDVEIESYEEWISLPRN